MSIFHEALKKAAGEASRGPMGKAGVGYFSYGESSHRFLRGILLAGLIFFGGVLFYYLYGANRPLFHPSRATQSAHVVRPASTVPPKVDALARVSEGLDFYKKGDLPKAEQAFEAAVHSAPDLAVAHNNLGLVLRHEGRLKEAVLQYQEALRLDSQYAEANHNLGLVYELTGRFDEAISHYRRALELNPSLAEAHYHLAAAFEREGDLEGAKKEYRSYLSEVKGPTSEKLGPIRQHLQDLQRR
jgi:tetratricopeptide (TPR) repeat protein